MTPDQLRELIGRMPTDERISALYGIAPKLLALWEAVTPDKGSIPDWAAALKDLEDA